MQRRVPETRAGDVVRGVHSRGVVQYRTRAGSEGGPGAASMPGVQPVCGRADVRERGVPDHEGSGVHWLQDVVRRGPVHLQAVCGDWQPGMQRVCEQVPERVVHEPWPDELHWNGDGGHGAERVPSMPEGERMCCWRISDQGVHRGGDSDERVQAVRRGGLLVRSNVQRRVWRPAAVAMPEPDAVWSGAIPGPVERQERRGVHGVYELRGAWSHYGLGVYASAERGVWRRYVRRGPAV